MTTTRIRINGYMTFHSWQYWLLASSCTEHRNWYAHDTYIYIHAHMYIHACDMLMLYSTCTCMYYSVHDASLTITELPSLSQLSMLLLTQVACTAPISARPSSAMSAWGSSSLRCSMTSCARNALITSAVWEAAKNYPLVGYDCATDVIYLNGLRPKEQ